MNINQIANNYLARSALLSASYICTCSSAGRDSISFKIDAGESAVGKMTCVDHTYTNTPYCDLTLLFYHQKLTIKAVCNSTMSWNNLSKVLYIIGCLHIP